MKDIFESKILCSKCDKVMKPELISKNGFNLRAVKCEKCGEVIIHPSDKQEYEEFIRLKQKEFNVKMRMVGNSYAVSIPREIVEFMHEQEAHMDNMVRLCFEEMGRLSLMFNSPEDKAHIIKSREVKIVKNNNPVIHVKEISDSKNPKNNKRFIYSDKGGNN
jgi:hypothetical protein